MKNKILKLSVTALFGATLVSCGGSNEATDTLIGGNFKDASVVGLGYSSTAGGTSVTGENGSFSCKKGENIKFFVGKLDLGNTACQELITPAEVVGGGDSTSDGSLNMVRFLNSIDSGLTDGEIKIPATLTAQLADYTGSQLTFNTPTANFDIAGINTFLTTISGAQTLTALISSATAKAHVENTVKCSYSGAYAGSITNSPTKYGAVYITPDDGKINYMYAAPYSSPNSYYDASGSSTGSIVATNNFTISSTYNVGEVTAITITAKVLPVNISGNWSEAGSTESGSFSFNRIGGDKNAKLRFGGKISTMKVLTMDVDIDNKVSAHAFNTHDGKTIALTGTYNTSTGAVSAVATGYTLTATINTSTFVASNTLWNYGTGTASFTAKGCELNK